MPRPKKEYAQANINEREAAAFYSLTKETVEYNANERGIQNLNVYYQLTDYADGSVLRLNELKDEPSQAFCQLAFHAQNASFISKIVDFSENYVFLKGKLCDFDPKAFWNEYHDKPEEDAVKELRFSETTGEGLKWRRDKSNNPDTIIKRYLKSLLQGAEYIKRFTNRSDLVDDLKTLGGKATEEVYYRKIIDYFREKVDVGFSVALTCDYLKELHEDFSYLPKPDVHIKNTLCAFFNRPDTYYNSNDDRGDYACIEDLQRLTDAINKGLCESERITEYQLDRMIWLNCTCNFFLTKGISKKEYLKCVKEKCVLLPTSFENH